MARLPEVVKFAQQHDIPVMSIDDLVNYLQAEQVA